MMNDIKRHIDAERAKELLKSRLYETALNNVGNVKDASEIYIEIADNRVSDWIDAVPTADGIEEKIGYNKKEEYPSLFECSVCEWYCSDTYYGDTGEYLYCPHCGTKILKKREFFRIRRVRTEI